MDPINAGEKTAYIVIADSLRDSIKRHVWEPGDKLPSERDLMQKFGVARMTVRSALDVLQFEGLITRRRGRSGGTFVRGVIPTLDIAKHPDYTARLAEYFDSVELKLLRKELMGADNAIASELNVPLGEHVLFIERVGLADGVPYMVERIHVRAALLPGVLDTELEGSLRGILERRWPDLHVEKQVDTFIPAVTTGVEQNVLKLTRNTPIMKIVRALYSSGGDKISHSEKLFRTDLINIQLTIR